MALNQEDHYFLDDMVRQHATAISHAKNVLMRGNDPKVKALAKQLIKEHSARMQNMISMGAKAAETEGPPKPTPMVMQGMGGY